MTFESIRLAHRDGASTITLDRPPVNAVSPGLMQEALSALDALEGTRCIALTGNRPHPLGSAPAQPGRSSE